MTKKRGTQHQHRRRRGRIHQPDPWHGVMYGACQSADDLDELKRGLHDALIAQLGEHRRGGVVWRIIHGRDDITQTLERLMLQERVVQPHEIGPNDAQPEAMLDYLARLSARLADWPDGYLVVATAEAIRPDLRR